MDASIHLDNYVEIVLAATAALLLLGAGRWLFPFETYSIALVAKCKPYSVSLNNPFGLGEHARDEVPKLRFRGRRFRDIRLIRRSQLLLRNLRPLMARLIEVLSCFILSRPVLGKFQWVFHPVRIDNLNQIRTQVLQPMPCY